MGIIDKIREAEADLDRTKAVLNKTANYLEKGKQITDYWGSAEEQNRAKKALEKWERKTKMLCIRYLILWIFMIGYLIYNCAGVIRG